MRPALQLINMDLVQSRVLRFRDFEALALGSGASEDYVRRGE